MNSDSTTAVHFLDSELLDPTNPVTVNLIGAGGTGSKMLTALMEMHHSLLQLGHAGLSVRLWDDDKVSPSNLGRQRFAACEVGLFKSVALINRANRWMGTNWKAETERFQRNDLGALPPHVNASIYLSCVDTVEARFEIADILKQASGNRRFGQSPKYWMDFGNSRTSGQVILSTVGEIRQPKSAKYQVVQNLPFITDEFGELLRQSETGDDAPSCSLAEALHKQDLFINATLAQMGSSLLWTLFRQGMTEHRGFFLNLDGFHAQPLKVAG